MQASIVKVHGVPYLKVNDEIIQPVSFRSFWPQEKTIHAFAENGFRLMSVFPTGILCSLKVPYSQFGEVWLGEGRYDWAAMRAQMDAFVTQAPQAYFSLMVQLDTRDWFLREHPEASNTFTQLARDAGWQVWRQSAAHWMTDLMDFLDREYPEKVFAVFICAGGTCEWYNTADQSAADADGVKEQVFAQWSRDAQRKLPDAQALAHASHGAFRDPHADRDALDYWRFHNEIIADTICYFAAHVKAHTHRSRLVGCFFGYLMQLLPLACGHTDFQRVLASPDVDIFFAPASYRFRGLESTSGPMIPLDSLVLHDKLYFHEIDNTTYLANGNPYAQVLQVSAHRRLKDLYQTTMYARREAAMVMSKGLGHWWFDMFSGWYDAPEMMRELVAIREASARMASAEVRQIGEVAVLVDGPSHYYCAGLDTLLDQQVFAQVESLHRMGCPVDFYSAQDLLDPRFPKARYKLYLFPNLFAPTQALREAVAELRAQGACLVFQYAAGAIGADGFDVAQMCALTQMELTETQDDIGWTVVDAGALNDSGMTRIYGVGQPALRPSLICTDAQAEGYGRDLLTKAMHLAVKPRTKGYDAWSLAGALPSFVLRGLARRAGVFLFETEDLPLFANSRMVSLFDHEGGTHTLRVPWARGRLTEMYTGETHAIQEKAISLTFAQNETKCFLYEEV